MLQPNLKPEIPLKGRERTTKQPTGLSWRAQDDSFRGLRESVFQKKEGGPKNHFQVTLQYTIQKISMPPPAQTQEWTCAHNVNFHDAALADLAARPDFRTCRT